MTYATKELTVSLQKLVAAGVEPETATIPTFGCSLGGSEFVANPDVEAFLAQAREYEAKTRNISIACY